MDKIQILTTCQACSGKAYLPTGEEISAVASGAAVVASHISLRGRRSVWLGTSTSATSRALLVLAAESRLTGSMCINWLCC